MTVLSVGAGQTYNRISDAVASSRDGDVIQVQAGTYTNDFAEINSKITIRAVGGTANLVATTSAPNGKAILTTNTDVTIDGLSFTGGRSDAGNGAGIRYQGGNLTIANSRFADNQNGILAAPDAGGSITIDGSEFAHNGTGDGRTHNIYINEVGTLTVRNSYFHDAVVGHEIKSRAYTTLIEGNRISNGPNGTASYNIDLPEGGNATIRNNTIEKGPNASNPYLIHYGGEEGPHAGSSLTVSGNTLIAPAGGAGALKNDTGITASFTDNKTQNIPAANLSNGPANISGTVVVSGQTVSSASPLAAPAPTPAPAPASETPAATGTGKDTLVVEVSEDAWGGDAQFLVSVDGKQVGGTQTATASHGAGETQRMTFMGDFGSGQHQIGVRFINDAYAGTPDTDRNLYVHAVELNGVHAAKDQAVLLSNGTVNFTVDTRSASASATLPSTEQTLSTVAPGLLA